MKLFLNNIEDTTVRDNFQSIEKAINDEPILRMKGKFFEITVESAVTNLRYTHRLGFQPKDVITTQVSDNESVIWNFDLFTKDFLDLTTSGACTIRAFIGRYEESQ